MIDMPTISMIRQRRARGDSVAKIARETGVSEPTVRKYLKKDDFAPKIPLTARRPSVIDPYRDAIEAMLDEDSRTWRKQRHTARRIHERLRDEHGADIGYTTVQKYVKERRAAREGSRDRFLDLEWPPGEAQVDFGQADMCERGVVRRMHFLTVCFPQSNVGLSQVFRGENAECVCQGLKNVFEYVKGVPRRIVFDNGAGAGRKVCGAVGTTELFGRFAAHYGFEFAFCNPYSGHEKGSVENKVGATRRRLFVPVPRFQSLGGFNARLLDRCMALSEEREHYSKGEPESRLFMEDRAAMADLPAKPFEVVSYDRVKADEYGKVCLDGRHRYSGDPALGGERVIVAKTADRVRIHDRDGALVAEHERAYGDAPTDSSDPSSQLALLCLKQNGWHNSRVRSGMPDALREAMDAMEKPERGAALRALRNASAESGYANAIDAAASSVEMLGCVDEAAVEVMARIAADERQPATYERDAGLGDYDAALGLKGAGHGEA